MVFPRHLELGSTGPGEPTRGAVCLANNGDAELQIGVTLRGTGFSVQPSRAVLAPGLQQWLEITFVGQSLGRFLGELTVHAQGGSADEDQHVDLSVSVAQVRLSMTPAPALGLHLGSVPVGSTAAGTVTLRNLGNTPAVVDTAFVEGPGSAFSVTRAGRILVQPQETVALQVDFCPDRGGLHEAHLVLVGADLVPERVRMPIAGRGLAPRALVSPAPQVGISFGRLNLGESDTRLVTVVNEGEADLRIVGAEVSSADFAIVHEPGSGSPIPPGGRQELAVTFRPRYEGRCEARLTISCNDPAQPRLVLPVIGSATVAPPEIAILNESAIDFGSVAVGRTDQQHLWVWNRGGAPCTVGALLAGEAAADFALDPPSVLVPPGDVRRIAVDFCPKETGPREAELQLTVPTGVELVRLLGVGKFLELTPTTLELDRAVVGTSLHVAVDVYNFGNADFTVTGVVSSDPKVFAVRSPVGPGSKFVLPANGLRPLPVSVTFSPPARGLFTGAVQLQGHWDGSFESREVLLSGTGIAADIELHPAGPFEFEHVVLGEAAAQTVVATNTGDTELRVEAHPESEEVRIEPQTFALAPGESATLSLLFAPAALGVRTGTVQLISNAVQERALPLRITGRGALPSVDLERAIAVLASRAGRCDTLPIGWNNSPVVLHDGTKLDLVFRIPPELRRAMVGRRFCVEWVKLDQNLDPQGGPTTHELQIDDTGESRVLLEQLNLRLLEQDNRRVRLRVSTQDHANAPVYSVSQIFEAGGWKWEFEAKPLVSFLSVRPSRSYTDRNGSRVRGRTERLIGLPALAFFGFHNSDSDGLSGVHITAIGNVLEALSTENSIAVSMGLALSFYKDRFMLGVGWDVYDHRVRDQRLGTKDFIMTFKYWGLSR